MGITEKYKPLGLAEQDAEDMMYLKSMQRVTGWGGGGAKLLAADHWWGSLCY